MLTKVEIEEVVTVILNSGVSLITFEKFINEIQDGNQLLIEKILVHIKKKALSDINIFPLFNKLPLKMGKVVSFISLDEIKYVLASGSYIQIETHEKPYVLRCSLNDFLNRINNKKFIRIHRSTIINIDYVDRLLYSDFGEIDTKMKDNRRFRISNSYKKEYLKLFGL